jgi:hypothetical protein
LVPEAIFVIPIRKTVLKAAPFAVGTVIFTAYIAFKTSVVGLVSLAGHVVRYLEMI